jgi:hypothetical protein
MTSGDATRALLRLRSRAGDPTQVWVLVPARGP